MNMNEEYLDNLLKNMNNASAAPEADLKPAKEENAGGSLTPEEITALFDAAEKIANGEEPESLSDEPEDSPVSAPEETTPRIARFSCRKQQDRMAAMRSEQEPEHPTMRII